MIKELEITATWKEGTLTATGGSGEPALPWASTGAVPTVSGQQVDGPGVLKPEGAAGTNWSGCSIGPLKLFLEKN